MTAQSPLVSLKEHFDCRLAELEKVRREAKEALDHRLDSLNASREMLRDQASRFVTREELTLSIKVIEADINALKRFQANLEGKASQSAVVFSGGLALFGIILSIVLHFV